LIRLSFAVKFQRCDQVSDNLRVGERCVLWPQGGTSFACLEDVGSERTIVTPSTPPVPQTRLKFGVVASEVLRTQ